MVQFWRCNKDIKQFLNKLDKVSENMYSHSTVELLRIKFGYVPNDFKKKYEYDVQNLSLWKSSLL